MLTNEITRIRRTQSQKNLKLMERETNVRNAFSVNTDLRDKSVAIIDDVVTTGATVAELTSELLNQGALEVQVLCLARTPEI